ncbi:MAG: hypothetical protein AAF196_20010 [Planctomycetota bacterium]
MDARHAAELEELIDSIDRPAVESIADLAAFRERLTEPGSELARDLDRAELEFLRRVPGRSESDAVEHAETAFREARLRGLIEAPLDEASALFDLAELSADFRFLEDQESAARAQAAIDERAQRIEGVEDRLRFEASERYAILVTEEEDLDLDHRILRVEATRELVLVLAGRTKDRVLSKIARRLGRALNERRLQRRLEHVLTPRGAVYLENLSFVLLLLVFVTLGLQWIRGPERWLILVDGSICLYFIVEFFFKLSLVPGRRGWFIRNALTDLLPAIPAAILLMSPLPDANAAQKGAVLVRGARLVRIALIARYIRALRPLIAVFRLILFLIRGFDQLVRRFSSLLNRDFVFFERMVVRLPSTESIDPRTLAFRALRREHVMLSELEPEERAPLIVVRAKLVEEGLHEKPVVGSARGVANVSIDRRDIPVEHAIDALWRVEPDRLPLYLPRREILAVDRVVRILNAPIVRSLPVIRSVRSKRRFATPEQRVVDFGRRVALVLENVRERVLLVADMHGIVTGPQVLDRVATTMVNASKRPATRLLLFGGLFTIVRLLIGDAGVVGGFLSKFVATPLVVLGSVCLFVLGLGRWLKSLAGEASDEFKMTSEAHFLGLSELQKRRDQDRDLDFLARRVFRWEMPAFEAVAGLSREIRGARTGELPLANGFVKHDGEAGDLATMREELYRTALLYLHFLDGAPFHHNDVTTTQQLLANLSLQNIRNEHLEWGKKERKRLRRLAPNPGALLRGPHVWFHFVTESIAVETAKRVTDYNRNCLTLTRRAVATPEERVALANWIRRRRSLEAASRLAKTEPPSQKDVFRTTEFNALDFLTDDPLRDQHIEHLFGHGVLTLLKKDRERMIREIFGTRPLHELPRSKRTFNVYRFYTDRLSNGRVFLAPIYGLFLVVFGLRLTVERVVRSVREILSPDSVAQEGAGRASFAVAMRKIFRMRGPIVREALMMRARFDPAYCGAPTYWSGHYHTDDDPEIEQDLEFLLIREREREEPRQIAAEVRQQVESLHRLVREKGLQVDGPYSDELDRRRGERAVTVAWVVDWCGVRSLVEGGRWFEVELDRMESKDCRLPARRFQRVFGFLKRGRKHPVTEWLRRYHSGRRVSRRGRSNFIRAYHDRGSAARRIIDAWNAVPDDSTPMVEAEALRSRVWALRTDIGRELVALRTIQSLSVLDVRNYGEFVFRLGNYAADGEVSPFDVETPFRRRSETQEPSE